MKRMGLVLLLVLGGICSGWTAEESTEKDVSFTYDDHGRRDPFWRLVTPSGMIMNYETDLSITDLSLEGILMGQQREKCLAIINGQVLRIGQKIGPFEIVDIREDAVALKQGQQVFQLKIKKED